MKLKVLYILIFFQGCLLFGSQEKIIKTGTAHGSGKTFEVTFRKGAHWNHKLKIINWLPFITINNVPQIAVWVEKSDGTFIETLYVTKKSATASWLKAPSDSDEEIERESALPYWSHRRNVKNGSGGFMPTKNTPLPDTVTSASPKSNFILRSHPESTAESYRLFVEINNSCDFNAYYRNDCETSDPAYSGGLWGSGQPALVYSTEVTSDNSNKELRLQLIGHSSPDGSTGSLYTDLSQVTTALEIIESITADVR